MAITFHPPQESILKSVQGKKVKPGGASSGDFFGYLLSEVRNGYFADPSHAGNKNTAAWKMIGYRGVRDRVKTM